MGAWRVNPLCSIGIAIFQCVFIPLLLWTVNLGWADGLYRGVEGKPIRAGTQEKWTLPSFTRVTALPFGRIRVTSLIVQCSKVVWAKGWWGRWDLTGCQAESPVGRYTCPMDPGETGASVTLVTGWWLDTVDRMAGIHLYYWSRLHRWHCHLVGKSVTFISIQVYLILSDVSWPSKQF